MYAIILEEQSDVLHYGTKRHSGRYPYGSGERPFQSEGQFNRKLKKLNRKSLNEQGSQRKLHYYENYLNTKSNSPIIKALETALMPIIYPINKLDIFLEKNIVRHYEKQVDEIIKRIDASGIDLETYAENLLYYGLDNSEIMFTGRQYREKK